MSGTDSARVTHSDMALAVARETGWDLDTEAADREWSAIGLGPVGQHRDSHALDRSNFDVVYSAMHKQFGEAVDITRFGHWAVGWVEEVLWDAGREDITFFVTEQRAALEDYPVADEEHFSRLEDEENHPGDGYCYSDSPDDCGCELPAA